MSTPASGILGGAPYGLDQVAVSRSLGPRDNGVMLECTAAGLTLTVPNDLPAGFGCSIIPNGTTSVATSGGTLLNGSTSTLTRLASGNAIFAIAQRPSLATSYVVTGS